MVECLPNKFWVLSSQHGEKKKQTKLKCMFMVENLARTGNLKKNTHSPQYHNLEITSLGILIYSLPLQIFNKTVRK
jgi:hypothetical protein